MSIDQAIFTSARTQRGDGYQLVARSAGVTDAEAQELTAWGPSHDSLFDQGPSSVSYNAWMLSSGRACVSRAMSAGAEFSKRGGLRVYTQFLLASDDVIERFAGNPFAVLKAALADGHLTVLERIPAELPQFKLAGRASVVSRTAIDRLRTRLGPVGLAAAMQAVLSSESVALASGLSPYLVYSAVINCLPPECRMEFSFTTGLRFSVRRRLRLFVAPADDTERRQVVRASRCALLDTSEAALAAVAIDHGWAAFLRAALAAERPLDLTSVFSQPRPGLTADKLDQLGNELAADLANGKISRTCPLRATDYHRITDSVHGASGVRVTLSPEALDEWRAMRATMSEDQALRDTKSGAGRGAVPGEERRSGQSPAHSPPSPQQREPVLPSRRGEDGRTDCNPSYRREPAYGAAASAARSPAARSPAARSPAARSSATRTSAARTSAAVCDDPRVTEALESLDDLVFEAIEGRREALAKLRKAWPQALAALGPEAVEESRLLYIERATAIWAKHNSGMQRRPDLAASALEVLTLILGSPPKLRG